MLTSAMLLLLAGLSVRAYLKDDELTAAGFGLVTLIAVFLLLP